MSEPKFTPGSYRIQPYVDGIDIIAADGSVIAHIADRPIGAQGMPPDNAKLLAASTKLFAACARAIEEFKHLGQALGEMTQPEMVDAWNQCETAIAEALGETP